MEKPEFMSANEARYNALVSTGDTHRADIACAWATIRNAGVYITLGHPRIYTRCAAYGLWVYPVGNPLVAALMYYLVAEKRKIFSSRIHPLPQLKSDIEDFNLYVIASEMLDTADRGLTEQFKASIILS